MNRAALTDPTSYVNSIGCIDASMSGGASSTCGNSHNCKGLCETFHDEKYRALLANGFEDDKQYVQ